MRIGPGSERVGIGGHGDGGSRLRPVETPYHARIAVVLGTVAIGCSVAACGASYQAIYEGEVRFEHCYRLDEESVGPPGQRRECWREWSQYYTYGQTRDRIEYALMRQRVLTRQASEPDGPQSSPGPAANAGVAPVPTLAAPGPTSPFEPPPHVHSVVPPTASPSSASGTQIPLSPGQILDRAAGGNAFPGQACWLQCATAWRMCAGNCVQGNAVCRAPCEGAFSTCARGCL